MASKRKVWPLNQDFQDDDGFGAEILRAQHHAATSGGTGVDHPTAMKVVAKAAPDNTVMILPGGGTVKSPFAGAQGQSYYIPHMETLEHEVTPTGSSERHDVVVMRFADPQYGTYPPGAPQRELTPEEASQYDWYWPEVHQNRSASSVFDFPHLMLAQIRRDPNKTVVEDNDIVDLRKLANPQKDWQVEGRNLFESETQSLHTTSTIWPEAATHNAKIPDFATRVQILATVGSARAHHTAGDDGVASGNFRVRLVHPDGSTLTTQQTEWRTSGQQDRQQLNIVFSHQLAVPDEWRGQTVRVEFHARKYYGPNVYADGGTSYSLQMFFTQEIA